MTIKSYILAAVLLGSTTLLSTPVKADTPYIGQLELVGHNFCPRDYSTTEGQLLPIAQYTALFSLIGTTYGGDGRTTFGLPDLRGRSAVHYGNGPGLPSKQLGQRGGSETNTMLISQMPSHNHRMGVRTFPGGATTNVPGGNNFAFAAEDMYASGQTAPGNFMDESTIQLNTAGSGQAQNNMQPYLTMYYCIALQGAYPSRP